MGKMGPPSEEAGLADSGAASRMGTTVSRNLDSPEYRFPPLQGGSTPPRSGSLLAGCPGPGGLTTAVELSPSPGNSLVPV